MVPYMEIEFKFFVLEPSMVPYMDKFKYLYTIYGTMVVIVNAQKRNLKEEPSKHADPYPVMKDEPRSQSIKRKIQTSILFPKQSN